MRQALVVGWSPEIADRLAEVQFLQGDPTAARQTLQEVVEQDGPTWEVLWRLGQAYVATGQPQEGLQLWERAAAWATGRYAVELLKDLADWYEHRQQPAKAKSYRVRALVREAVGHLDDGQPQAARPLLQQAVQLDRPRRGDGLVFPGRGRTLGPQPAGRRCGLSPLPGVTAASRTGGGSNATASATISYGQSHKWRPMRCGQTASRGRESGVTPTATVGRRIRLITAYPPVASSGL